MSIQELLDKLEELKKEYGPDVRVCLNHYTYPDRDIDQVWAFGEPGFESVIYIE